VALGAEYRREKYEIGAGDLASYTAAARRASPASVR
jgi:hypothetical protein